MYVCTVLCGCDDWVSVPVEAIFVFLPPDLRILPEKWDRLGFILKGMRQSDERRSLLAVSGLGFAEKGHVGLDCQRKMAAQRSIGCQPLSTK